MATVGHAYLKIMPSLEGLGRHLRREVAQAERQAPNVHVGVEVDQSQLAQFPSLISRATGPLSALGSMAGPTAVIGALGATAGVAANASGALGLLPGVLATAAAAAGTLKLGLSGIGEALSALGEGDAEGFAEALEGLSPAARSAMLTVQSLGASFNGLGLGVQQALFAGLSEHIRELAESSLPTLRSGMTGIASSVNSVAVSMTDFLASAGAQDTIGTIFDNVAASVAHLAPGITSIVRALLDMSAVGSGFLPGLANGISQAAQRFADFIAQARQTGQLQAWIRTGIDTFGMLGQVLGIIGQRFGPILAALGRLSGPLLHGMIDLMVQWGPIIEPVIAKFGELVNVVVRMIPSLIRIGMVIQSLAAIAIPAVLAQMNIWIGVARAVGSAVRWLAGILTFLQGPARAAAGAVAAANATISQTLTRMRQIAVAELNTFIGGFQALPGRLRAAMATANQWLVGVGREIVAGLKLGFQLAFPMFSDQAMAMARDMVSKVKGLFGIHSPSTVFAGIGRNLALGLADGIHATTALPQQAVTQMTTHVAHSAQLPAPASLTVPPRPFGASPPQTAQPATIHVHPQPGQSEAAIARAVSRRLAFDARL